MVIEPPSEFARVKGAFCGRHLSEGNARLSLNWTELYTSVTKNILERREQKVLDIATSWRSRAQTQNVLNGGGKCE